MGSFYSVLGTRERTELFRSNSQFFALYLELEGCRFSGNWQWIIIGEVQQTSSCLMRHSMNVK